jgi:hypothetical protein
VTGLVAVARARKKVSTITIAFDEALQAASADSIAFYQVAPVTRRRKKVIYGKPVAIASARYDGGRDVTIRLARPVKGPVRLLVSAGIRAADGTPSARSFTLTVG